jgi:hypothetical protein
MPRLFPHFLLVALEMHIEVYIAKTYIVAMSIAPISENNLTCVRTLRLKVKPESYSWLDAAAIEVNQVWNYCNEISNRAARPFVGRPKWLGGFDLNNLTAGATECFERIGSACAWRCSTSVCGNEPSPSIAPPSRAYRLREAGISAWTAAA